MTWCRILAAFLLCLVLAGCGPDRGTSYCRDGQTVSVGSNARAACDQHGGVK